MQIHEESVISSSPVGQKMSFARSEPTRRELSHVTPSRVLSPLSQEPVLHTSLPRNLQSTDDILAVDALNQLKGGYSTSTPDQQEPSEGATAVHTFRQDNEVLTDSEEFFDTANDSDSLYSGNSLRRTSTSERLYRKMRNHPIVSTAVQAYKEHKPAIKYGVEMVERAALPMVSIIEQTKSDWKRKRRLTKANAMFPDDAKVDISSASSLSSFSLHSSKRQKLPSITEALSMGNANWNELSMNMSIESKKRLQTCLQLLMLANKQLSSKVDHLQEVISKERQALKEKVHSPGAVTEDEGEVFHDATEDINDGSAEIKQEIVGTIKKVVTFISKYAGNSLPEPARTDVREELLRLPTKWSSRTSSSMLGVNTNAKVLVLANESLDMVRSVMDVFDDTLTKADIWVKQKQEKQLAKQAILNSSLQRQSEVSGPSTQVDETSCDITTSTVDPSEQDPLDH